MKLTPTRLIAPLLAVLLLLGQTPAQAETASLTHDNFGNITQRTINPGATSQATTTYSYDALNRLNTEAGPAKTQTLTYDADGNRLSDGSGSYTYDPNSNKMLTTRQGVSVSTDPSGRITTDGTGRTYTYNQAGQLYTVSKNSVLMATYYYNAQSQRTRKATTASAPQGAQTVVYHYDQQGHLLAETSGTGTPIRTYVWRDDTPIAQIEHQPTRKILYYEVDHLNTPRAAMDEAGKTLWRWESDAFGSTLPNEDADNDGVKTTVNLRFPGQYFDQESGLNYNYHRYYDPANGGRYTQPDPIGLAGGINPMVYVGGNPLSYIDPDGLSQQGVDPRELPPVPGESRCAGNDFNCAAGLQPPNPASSCIWVCKVKRRYAMGVCEVEITSSTNGGSLGKYFGIRAGLGITTSNECGWECGSQKGLVGKWGGSAAFGLGVTSSASITLNNSNGGAAASTGVTTGMGITAGPGAGIRW